MRRDYRVAVSVDGYDGIVSSRVPVFALAGNGVSLPYFPSALCNNIVYRQSKIALDSLNTHFGTAFGINRGASSITSASCSRVKPRLSRAAFLARPIGLKSNRFVSLFNKFI
jgi:hypothetical protein